MNQDHRESAYQVQKTHDRFEVRSASGTCMVVCSDADSAGHYAVLLNEAYKAGLKQGFRQARHQ